MSELSEDMPRWSNTKERERAVDAVVAMLEQMQVTKTVTQAVANDIEAAWQQNGADPSAFRTNGTL